MESHLVLATCIGEAQVVNFNRVPQESPERVVYKHGVLMVCGGLVQVDSGSIRAAGGSSVHMHYFFKLNINDAQERRLAVLACSLM